MPLSFRRAVRPLCAFSFATLDGPRSRGRGSHAGYGRALAVLAACLPAAVQAQSAMSPAADVATLPAVQVVSRRGTAVTANEASAGALGDLPLIQTPFSINVVTRELIDKQQGAFVGDVLKNDPSVTVGNVAVPFLLLRGFSVGTDGTLYDGLPGHGGFSDGRAGMQLIDQVEVLKGASAFLYGIGAAGSLGGIVNYIPKRPDEERLRRIGFGYTSRSLLSADADIGDRFGEGGQFGYRLNLGWRDGEQAVERYGWNQKAAALAFDWRARPGLVFNLGFDHVDNHIPQLPPFYIVAPGLDVPAAPNTKRSAALSWDDFKTRSNNTTLRMDWAFAPDWSVTAQALHNRSERPSTKEARIGLIGNAAGDLLLFGGQSASSNRNDSAQLLLHGKLDTGPLAHRLTFGLSGSRQDAYGGFADFGLFPSNLYQPVDSPEPATQALDSPHTSHVQSKSLLVSDIIAIDTQWSVLLGARRARLEVENFDAAGAIASTNSNAKTLPTAALMFRPTPASLVYLNFARGLEQGGALSPVDSTRFLPPLLTRQLELGAKLEHGGMAYTAALFDMQRPLETFDAASNQNVQRGQQRHRGIELVANGRLTPELTLVSGLMLLDTRLAETGDTSSEGKRAVGVPRLTANLWGEYRIAALPGLALNAGIYHSGRQYLDGANTQSIPAWTRLDLGASYGTRVGGVPTSLLLNIENATDKHYWASAQGGLLTTADPLTLKLGARFNF